MGRAPLRRRLLALAAAAVTLWSVTITAGSRTFSAAAQAMRDQLVSPLTLLRWELADLWPDDGLSSAAVMALGESPLLLSARAQITALWSKEPGDDLPPSVSGSVESSAPLPETPVVSPPTPITDAKSDLDFTDNGVPARTLVASDPSGYTVCGEIEYEQDHPHVPMTKNL